MLPKKLLARSSLPGSGGDAFPTTFPLCVLSRDHWADITVVLWMLHAFFGVVKDAEPGVQQESQDYLKSVWKDR